MALLTLGLNHKTAPVEIRERFAFSPENLSNALRDLVGCGAAREAAILSTCNRTEIYCGLDQPDTRQVLHWLSDYRHVTDQDVTPYLYVHPNQQAVRHILRVASGLDSMILGEPQILGQMKTAYAAATEAGTVGQTLGRLFQYTFSVAKQVRTDTAIGSSPVSVAFAAVSLARQIFGDLDQQTALLIGAGETVELVARHLQENHIKRIVIANRTAERAHALASEFNGFAIGLAEIPDHLHEADIVISSTASPLPILGKGMAERALKKRKHRPMFMVDIAVPRDIEAEVGDLADVYLYTVDDLQEIIQENLQSRQDAAKQAEEIIDTQVAHFMGWLRSLESVNMIRAYRDSADHIRGLVLEDARRELARGADPEQVLGEALRLLTNKLTHTPTVQMKQAGYDGRTELLNAARELLNLKADH